jgi:hypothetical protein
MGAGTVPTVGTGPTAEMDPTVETDLTVEMVLTEGTVRLGAGPEAESVSRVAVALAATVPTGREVMSKTPKSVRRCSNFCVRQQR